MATKITWYNKKATVDRIFSDKVGKFTAQTFARYADKFVPMDTGALSQTYVIRPFEVEYTVPYAKKVYTGTHINFRPDHHPLATALWDKPTMDAHEKQIAEEITQFIARM